MEGNKTGLKYRIQWITNIIKYGLFWHGVRNNLAKLGFDIMPYYLVREATEKFNTPEIRGDSKDFELSVFGEKEILYIKDTIIGIEQKDLIADLKRGEVCFGLKHGENIAAYMFIKRKSFTFRKRQFNLKSNESYLHSMYTFEDYRGKNIAPFLRYHSYTYLEHEGVDTFLSISEYFNKSTIRFKQKLKSKPLKLFLSVVFFKKLTLNFTLKTYK